MFFDDYVEFVNDDPRLGRLATPVTSESLSKRAAVLLPKWLIQDKRILDLGNCIGAFGHWALANGAKHYTGVDIHPEFCNKSNELLGKYWSKDKFNIHCSDVNEFLINIEQQYDIVLAAGILHGYYDVVGILRNITNATKETIIIETLDIDDTEVPKIEFRFYNMASPDVNSPYVGWSSVIGLNALRHVMHELNFNQYGDKIYPEKIINSHDSYNLKIQNQPKNPMWGIPNRFMVRYKRNSTVKFSLESNIKNGIRSESAELIVPKLPEHKIWEFDEEVASRFQQEAITNIPDYERVIDLCLEIVNSKFEKTATVVDVGSALGYTLDKFASAGYNVIGIESSEQMKSKSTQRDKVIVSSTFPQLSCDVVLANWTLHFVNERKEYLQNIYKNLNQSGVLILTDKTTQSETIKKLYYDFKRSNGITEEYIKLKEEMLKGYMSTLPTQWYIETLQEVGFINIQIINSRLGFVSFYCEK